MTKEPEKEKRGSLLRESLNVILANRIISRNLFLSSLFLKKSGVHKTKVSMYINMTFVSFYETDLVKGVVL